MNTETLIETNTKQAQATSPTNQKPQTGGSKEAERAHCGNGVCEVAWKPLPVKPGVKQPENK